MNKGINILAPAGGEEALHAAVRAGANSVYLGLNTFSARASAANFTPEQLARAVSFCHARGVSVNVTLNTLLYDREIPEFVSAVQAVCAAGADAVIVQDLAAARIVRQTAPEIALHGSTQMAVHSLAGAKQLAALGFSRVILARELPAGEIENITANCGIETEIFVHGALCVSLSGQCYMSAFLGGRSGNRGRCAGPCRLPFSAAVGEIPQGDEKPARAKDDYHLSLKDLSIIENIPEIQRMGVSCVKIEGRLRSAEYVAAAVDACITARSGGAVDMNVLRGAFSRQGFTDGFYARPSGALAPGKTMFGVRTGEDAALTKETLPTLRELYRRERQSVGVNFAFKATENALSLTATSGVHTAHAETSGSFEPAKANGDEAVRAALAKCGGTPFYMESAEIDNEKGLFTPNSMVNALRKEVLEALLAELETPQPKAFTPIEIPQVFPKPRTAVLHARFEDAAQAGQINPAQFAQLTFPLAQFAQVPESMRAKAVLELPRSLLEGQGKTESLIAAAKAAGFSKFEAGNIGHIALLSGCEIYGGFSLNVANGTAAREYEGMGLAGITLSPEVEIAALNAVSCGVPTGVLAYGHMPLMLTASCPLKNAGASCDSCPKKGYLTDRKGQRMPLLCKDGARHIFNPVPLYMGERMGEIKTDFATLYFTAETPQEVANVARTFAAGRAHSGIFTRGLYYKGVL